MYEIRLRVGRPLFVSYDGGECFLRKQGEEQYLVTREDLKETMEQRQRIFAVCIMRMRSGRDFKCTGWTQGRSNRKSDPGRKSDPWDEIHFLY